MTIAYSGDSITFPDNSVQATAPKVGMVNRIINGAMVIDQRNAGASVTADGSFPVDRWKIVLGGGGALTAQRSTTAPAGFINSLAFTVTTADTSLGTSDEYSVRHLIEGFNVSDLGWGTAAAQPVTLSFKVRSSLTGTFGGVIRNNAADRVYVFSYTITAANTFEDKSITIAGDTSGSWLTDNSIGLQLILSLGAGSARLSAAGSWGTVGAVQGATGQTQLIGTSGATFYITGVDLRKGSTGAYSNGQNDFDYRPYGTELGLCQRYCVIIPAGTQYIGASAFSTNRVLSGAFYPSTMRATPTATSLSTAFVYFINGAAYTSSAAATTTTSAGNITIDVTVTATAGSNGVIAIGAPITLSAEL